jgi:hypothetical protein
MSLFRTGTGAQLPIPSTLFLLGRRGAEKGLGLKRACRAPAQEVHLLLVFLTAAKNFSVCSRL